MRSLILLFFYFAKLFFYYEHMKTLCNLLKVFGGKVVSSAWDFVVVWSLNFFKNYFYLCACVYHM